MTQTEALRLYSVVDRVAEGDTFCRPWASFDPVKQGESIGIRHDGQVVKADSDGYVVFPNPGAQAGQEWFYLARAIGRV